jgi:hypothetical protein
MSHPQVIITDFKLKSEYYKGKNIEQPSKKTTITIVYAVQPEKLRKIADLQFAEFMCAPKGTGSGCGLGAQTLVKSS